MLFDEVAVPAHHWHTAPRYVSIAVTNTCELSCGFCYAPKYPARLDPVDVLNWLQELDSGGALGVGFGGGEPTSHPNFVSMCEQAVRRTRLAVTFTTHAHRIDSGMADRLTGNVHFIRVSMDGVGRVYENIRGRSFDRFCRALENVVRIAPFGLNVVLNSDTVGQLDDIAAFAKKNGASELLLLPQRSVSRRVHEVDSLSMARAKQWIRESSHSFRLAISERGVGDEESFLARPYVAEAPLSAHAHIDARGWIMSDAFSTDRVRIGSSVLHALGLLRADSAAS
jgi:MoaA/NifB/PqqE/SkfB family radical SAM enzyme